jgi:hypothetical protein
MRRIHRTVVLTEELLALSFGEVSQDHQRIGGVFRRLRGHALQLTLAWCAQPASRTGQNVGTVGPVQAIRPNDQLRRCDVGPTTVC